MSKCKMWVKMNQQWQQGRGTLIIYLGLNFPSTLATPLNRGSTVA